MRKPITIEEIERVGRLAKIKMSDDEKEKMASKLTKLDEWVDLLDEYNLQEVQPTSHAAFMQNVFRQDVCVPGQEREQLLKNAAEQDGECFVVPKVVD